MSMLAGKTGNGKGLPGDANEDDLGHRRSVQHVMLAFDIRRRGGVALPVPVWDLYGNHVDQLDVEGGGMSRGWSARDQKGTICRLYRRSKWD